jgi:hypothetical protein
MGSGEGCEVTGRILELSSGYTMSGRNSLLGWWYISIGLAFVALAVRSYVAGATGWGVGLRLIVAVGFVLLGNRAAEAMITVRS